MRDNLKAIGAYLVLTISILSPLITLYLIGNNIALERKVKVLEVKEANTKMKLMELEQKFKSVKSLERILQIKDDL